jgi:hypothetical protein
MALLLMAAPAFAFDGGGGHHGAGMHGVGPIRSDGPDTVAPAMTSPATTAAPSAPSTAPAFNFPTRGPGDLYAHKVPAAAMHESDAQWQARCVDHVDKDPITLVSTYRYKAGVADCP